MKISQASINIKNLRLRTYIGIKDEEIKNKQDIIVNVRINYDAEQALHSDKMDDALNYRTITKKIIQRVESERFSLLEYLTSEILSIASEHAWVQSAEVEVDKPHALRFADSVSMTLSVQK
ncbi:dihydroneopterin triphosphate 2'-epimerase [Algicola sagamiensis]|uniref:dihydroneopterin triphosphate 2'-epimerase n=1 Tax=Algicola sagamiensis TaxID=163869 RepID=UPI0003763DD6|nr:dihydroneopterin triphosphate 2'-epimerase [Algicola sagamiensis]